MDKLKHDKRGLTKKASLSFPENMTTDELDDAIRSLTSDGDSPHPALDEWQSIRSWVAKNIKVRRAIRIYTAVINSSWCCLEVYPDGDCACFGGPSNLPADKERFPLCVIHGTDIWGLRDDYSLEIMRTSQMEHFILPEDTYLCEHSQFDGDDVWVLSKLADNWWRIRNVLLQQPEVMKAKGE